MDELEYTPSPEEQAMVNLVKSWLKNSKTAYADRKKIMKACYDAYKESYKEKGKSKTKANSRRNYIFSSVEDALALLTDGRPSLDCWPRSKEDVQMAEKAKQVLDYIWEAVDLDYKLPMAERDHIIAGLGWLKIYYDPNINYPDGEIAVDVVNPMHLWPDPDATNEENMRYIIQEDDTPLWFIRKNFPEKGKYVKADPSISIQNNESDTKSAEISHEHFSSDVTSDANHYRAKLLECWMKDDSIFEEDEMGEDGERIHQAGEMKYPNGRKVVIAGDVWLNQDDDQNPFIDGEHPYVMIPNYEMSDSFFPMGDVEYLIETNNDINKIVSRLNDYIRHTCHTTIVYDKECNLDEDSLDNLEAALVPKDKQGSINIFAPPPWPSSIFEWLDTCKSDLEVISGIREVLQGRSPTAGQSGVAFEKLQEFALSRIRKKSRNIDSAIKKIGKKIVSRMKQYYTDTRQIRITGDFPVKEMQPMLDQMGMPQADPYTGEPMMQEQVTGTKRYDFIEFNNQEFYPKDADGNVVREIELDVILEVGAAASVSREQDKREVEFLLKAGIIDKEEAARRFNIKNYKEIKARMEQELMKQQQMLQQQMQSPQAPPALF